MGSNLPLFPEQASTIASEMDALFFFLVAVSVFFGVLIAAVLVFFAIRYRRRRDDERPAEIHGSLALELIWTLIPLGIVTVVFFWSAHIFFTIHRVPKDAIEIHVVGKRWMWKVQHLNGRREIDELHVPVGVPVKITLTSEDVIHSFYVPAFRVKKDAVPGRYNTTWFEVTKPGRYHLFCAEYCGTQHSGMIGSVIAMEPNEFQVWLEGGVPGESLASAGEKLFRDLACATCHRADSGARGPNLVGIFGSQVLLSTGSTITADQSYIRESIVNPSAKVVAGYQPIMPTFQGLVSEERLMQLVAYVQSLAPEPQQGEAAAGTVTPSEPKP
jgi:cytochrome c oxidase subunit II